MEIEMCGRVPKVGTSCSLARGVLIALGLKLGAFSLGRGAGGKFGKEFVDRTTYLP